MPVLFKVVCRPGLVCGDIYIQETPTGRKDWPIKYRARTPIAIFGSTNFPDSLSRNPFDEDFRDNYCEGIGMTMEVAVKKLNENLEIIYEGLWY